MGRVAATLFLLLLTTSAFAEHTGVVFTDDNRNGARDSGEAPREGIAVTNGRDVVVTGADGRYALSERDAGFVSITCPADGACPLWHRRGGGDFGVAPAPMVEDFFFVHMSDVHAYPKLEDLADMLPSDGLPWWLPRNVAGWFLLRGLAQNYPHLTKDEIAGHLRDVVVKHHPVDADAWSSTVMVDYLELAIDPATGIITPEIDIPRAFSEVAALRPTFVVSTGDLILEGNNGDPDPVERWYRYYLELVEASGLEIYETIGNNELAGTANDSFPPSDPRYGKALYRRYLGPTHYSFDRGPFHFVAVDTHRREFEEGEDEEWSFEDMEPEIRDWLDADLSAARGRKIILLNHEPFHYDPIWDFDDPRVVQDEGLLEKHGVLYTLTGHIHRNGFQDAPEGGGTTHITTGAVSGFRWSLPTTFDSRGYRLFYARGGRLYSAWKDLDRPLLGFIDPKGDGRCHPASTHAAAPSKLRGKVSVVAVATDVDGPFEDVHLFLGDEPLVTTRWGDYFVHASFEAEALGEAPSYLELKATGRDGTLHQARLDVSRSTAK